jgi:hypothetical protein
MNSDTFAHLWPQALPSPRDIHGLAANCRPDSWQRLASRLACMHVPARSGPEVLVNWLQAATGPARVDAQRVLRAMERHPWRVASLTGPYRRAARLGFRVVAGDRAWWLQFEPAPRLRIVRIEALRSTLP